MRRKKVLAVLLRWDYGQQARGDSGEKTLFFENLKQLVSDVEPFWYDEYLKDKAGLQRALLQKAADYQPDLVFFVPFGEQFDLATLDALKSRCATYAWFGDDPWRFADFSSRLAPHFTHVSTTDRWSVSRYRKLGVSPILTQWAAEPTWFGENGRAPATYRHDVSFVGTRNSVREWFIGMLAKRGVKVECYGWGWPNGKVTARGMGEVFHSSKININLSNSVTNDVRYWVGKPLNFARYLTGKKRDEQVKARNFEIPMAGGFQLSNYALGLEQYFDLGREIAVFNSPEECAAQVEYFLAHEDERLEIAHRGHARAKKEHSYRSRLEKVLEAALG